MTKTAGHNTNGNPPPNGGGTPNDASRLNVLSLFAGIGGLDLGLERAGMTIVGQVEIDPYCQSVLATHWPEVPRHDDVRTAVDWWRGRTRPSVHVVAGGFPCQPVSGVGRRLAQADGRWLWQPMLGVIATLRPSWIVVENVPGLLRRGLAIVLGDLDRLGYRTRPGLLSACAVGAPHTRERMFVLAHSADVRHQEGRRAEAARGQPTRKADLPHTDRFRADPAGSSWWAVEPDVGRVAYGVPAGVDRRRALGNAVVPQVAEYIGRLIVNAHQGAV